MTKILFICLGNICRSPMAEFVMKDLVEKAGISAQDLPTNFRSTPRRRAAMRSAIPSIRPRGASLPSTAFPARDTLRASSRRRTTRSTICSSAWRARTSKTCSASAAVIRRGRCTGCSTTPTARATSPTRGIQAILKRRGGMSRRAVRAFWRQFKIKTCKVRKAGLWSAFLHLFGVLNNFYRGCSEFVKNFHSGITRFA